MKEIIYMHALNEARHEEMSRDPKVFIMGEDIHNTKELVDAFGIERVRGCPISESAFSGAAVGAAAMGYRPIVWLMFGTFVYVAMDQIVNQAAKLRYMTGGQVKLPIVYWVPIGSGFNAGAQHSDHPLALLGNSPGLKIVLPSTPYDAKGLLKAAIRDDNPVIFFEEQMLGMTSGEIPDEDYIVPIGKGDIKREGSDVTVVAIGSMVPRALTASRKLQRDGISVEVVDPRSLVPLDKDLILESVKKTGRLIVLEDAPPICSFASEISAVVAEYGFSLIKSPILRVTRHNVPVPFSPSLENAVLPNEKMLINAVTKIMQ